MEDKKVKKEYITLPNGKTMTKKTWIMASLRRASYRWPPRAQIEREARRERGKYECAVCKELFKAKEYAIDHLQPVIPYDGFPIHPVTGGLDWTIIIDRLFCDKENLQIICHADHSVKSDIEDGMRAAFNAKKKADEKLLKKKK